MPLPLSRSLQAYVLDWQRLPWPAPWERTFARQAPLALEIGFGNGGFMEREARSRPERNHLGIELSWTAATHLFRRLHRERLENVRVLLGDAEALVRHLFAPDELAEVFVNHPCPWPKARHLDRRLLKRGFLELLAERMAPGARLTVVTDHAEYAAWLAEELSAQRALVSCHPGVEVAELPDREPTKYQLKAMAQGIPIHYFQWRRPPLAPLSREGKDPGARAADDPRMPTLKLSGDVRRADPFPDFTPRVFRERVDGVEVVVKLEALFRREGIDAWLVQTLVQEDQLRQQFGIDVVARPEEWLLKPSELGFPYPTHGVRRALWCVGRLLQTRFPELRVSYESLGPRVTDPVQPWP